MQQSGSRGRPSSSGAARGRTQQSADDWLGDISDYDWSENAAEQAERGNETPSGEDRVVVDDPGSQMAGPDSAAEAHRAVVERRRLIAGLVVAAVLGIAIVIALLLLRGGNGTPATTTHSGDDHSDDDDSGDDALRRRRRRRPYVDAADTGHHTLDDDPGDRRFLLHAARRHKAPARRGRPGGGPRASAGPDHRRVRPRFCRRQPSGRATEAAVTAFQQDNGLSADGVVGPETASALNSAISAG